MPAATRARRSNNGTAAQKSGSVQQGMSAYPFRFDVIRIELMFVDRSYQRPLTDFAAKIEQDFNPALIQTVALSERSNGKFAVIDGQTRMVAAEKLGYDVLPACVFTGLGVPEEAAIFEQLGTARRALKTYDRFRAAITRGDPEAIAIQALVDSLGLEIGSKFPEQIIAVGALRSCYRRDGIQLERTLVNLKEAWPDRAPAGDMIKGMHLFFTPRNAKLRRERQGLNDEKLVMKLQVAGPDQIRRRVNAAREAAGVTTNASRYTARAIASINGEKNPTD